VSLGPQLRDDLVIVPQTYRGEETYIVKDPVSHKYFRFRPIEIVVMQSLDGERTVAAAAAELAAEGVPINERALGSFAQSLTRMGLMVRSVGERSVLELERLRAERKQRRKKPLFRGSILRMRWTLADPDAAFDRWMPHLGFFFSKRFLVGSLALFLIYGLIVALQWPEFRSGLAGLYTDFSPGHVAILFVTISFIIFFHEIGHGVACKYFGGRVHEMGAMLIYFTPAFYCNVNDAWTFPERSARLWVTAAGSWIQLVIASIAAIVWWAAVPDSVVSQIALTAVVFGGAMTVLANANPLIPLDGYYALSDWLEISNMRQRALAHAGWLVRRHVLRLDVPEPVAAADERRVLLIYGALAAAYSGAVLTLVALTVYGWARSLLGVAGGIAFLIALLLMLRGKIMTVVRTVRGAIREHKAKWRASPLPRRLGIGAALVALVMLVTPWPVTTSGAFVASPAAFEIATAPDSGVVFDVVAREGMDVAAGTPLLRLRNLELERDAITAARLRDSLQRRELAARASGDASAAERFGAQRRSAEATAGGLAARSAALTVRSVGSGRVVSVRPEELVGRAVRGGDTLIRLASSGGPEAHVVLDRPGATLVAAGQSARLVLDDGRRATGTVASVAPANAASGAGLARVSVAADWRPGSTGLARITLDQGTLASAAWWRIRSGVRSDLLF